MSKQSGLTTLELAVMLAALIGALIAMYPLVTGAIAGRWKQAGDVFSSGLQYEPNRTVITFQ